MGCGPLAGGSGLGWPASLRSSLRCDGEVTPSGAPKAQRDSAWLLPCARQDGLNPSPAILLPCRIPGDSGGFERGFRTHGRKAQLLQPAAERLLAVLPREMSAALDGGTDPRAASGGGKGSPAMEASPGSSGRGRARARGRRCGRSRRGWTEAGTAAGMAPGMGLGLPEQWESHCQRDGIATANQRDWGLQCGWTQVCIP